MPSDLTKTLSAYKKALDKSQGRYESMYETRAKNTKEFYESFFKNLIRPYNQKINDSSERRRIKRIIENLLGTTDIKFAAIDGTSYKDRFGDYMVFFGASYSARGELSLVDDPPKIKYERWAPEQDVSLVAYVPIPFAELGNVAETQFKYSSDTERIDLTSIHSQLMQLAEVYLAYDLASTSTLKPKLILWDQSMSGVMASTDIGVESIDMIGYKYIGKKLSKQDIIISYSHPYNDDLQVPSKKNFRIYNYVIKRLFQKSPQKLSDLAVEIGMDSDILLRKIKNYLLKPEGRSILFYDESSDELSLNSNYNESWDFVVKLFENLCERLYKDKDQSVLIYKSGNGEEKREKWLTPDDLRFLISVGLRALIEKCWDNNIIFIGIAKDSSSKYLSRNYLGVMREINEYSFEDVLLPWTDRTFLELMPYIDDNLETPWSTIEFDSLFMTLAYRQFEGESEPKIRGVKGDVLTSERVFMRSLGQFYLNREKATPLTGHVIFIDRLSIPMLDKGNFGDIEIDEERIGKVKPIIYKENENQNYGQDISIFLLDCLTKNLYPEVIGYPDPLHKADWGAKSILKKVKYMIRASGSSLKSRPLNKTFRQIRDSLRRT